MLNYRPKSCPKSRCDPKIGKICYICGSGTILNNLTLCDNTVFPRIITLRPRSPIFVKNSAADRRASFDM